MALVNMRCENCGAPLRENGDCYICEYCGSVVIHIPGGEGEYSEGMSPGELKQKLFESGRSYTVVFPSEEEGDIDAAIIRGKLRLAEKQLDEGNAYLAEETLKGLPEGYFPAERLRFLAFIGARDEAELAMYSGDIRKLPQFERLLTYCNEQNRETYIAIADVCLSNSRAAAEIDKGRQMILAGMKTEALDHAAAMVKKYPQHSRAWELLIEARCCSDPEYSPFADLEYFKACPDAVINVTGGAEDGAGLPLNISPLISSRCREIRKKQEINAKFIRDILIRPAVVVAVILALIGIWKLIDMLFS